MIFETFTNLFAMDSSSLDFNNYYNCLVDCFDSSKTSPFQDSLSCYNNNKKKSLDY